MKLSRTKVVPIFWVTLYVELLARFRHF